MSKSIEELEAIIAKGRAVVLDFMPNIKNCVLQNYGQLDEFLLESRPQEKSDIAKRATLRTTVRRR